MSDYNIQMHEYNGAGYDNLYPKTKAKNVYLTDEYTLEDFWIDETIDPILDNNSFAVIKTVSDAGNGASYWSVGDRKGVSLSGAIGQGSYTVSLSGTWYMSILGFNHNSSKEGSNRIHFQFGWTASTGGVQVAFCTWSSNDTWGTSAQNGAGGCMNTTNTNSGGWPQCIMRTGTLGQSPSSPVTGSFMAALPKALRDVMKSVTKTTNKGNSGGATYETSVDYLFLPSEYEVFATNGNSGGNQDQVQYDYYKGVSAGSASKNAFTAASKIRYNHQNQSQAVYWWERSPYSSHPSTFCYVTLDGNASNGNAYFSLGIAPCLCI